jgi:hypothetical protein
MINPTKKINFPVTSTIKSSICALTLLVGGQAFAATITVDNSTCTLPNAITSANTDTATGSCAAGSGNDIINFASALSGQTIALTSALPDLTTNITIDGSSLTSHVQISGANAYRVFNITGGTIVLTHLDIINGNNDGNNGGGGIKNAGTLTINYSTLANNHSGPGFSGGGGIYNDGLLTVNNSTFSNNSAVGSAGGIFNANGTLTVNNSTFSGNSASDSGSSGGGIANGDILIVNNSTFSGNSAGNGGGGIGDFGGTVTLRNTILANNGGKDCSGTIATALNNLIQTTATACGLTNGINGNKIGVNPLLGALANNGGLTQTLALLTGSPAINAGDAATCISTDQRGTARAGVCDIGAFEAAAAPSTPTSAPLDFAFSHKHPEIYSREIKIK